MMRTLESAPASSFRRDLALARRIAVMLFQYLVQGGRLRREYRRREARGEVFWVDAAGPTRHREEAIREAR
jgi:hypothetical protein